MHFALYRVLISLVGFICLAYKLRRGSLMNDLYNFDGGEVDDK